MQKLFVLPIVILLAVPALAEKKFQGFTCENECPLAQHANLRRSLGTEAQLASTVVRSDLARRVERNLARI